MCKIIQFPIKESNGYKNLSALFAICDTVESCNFYLESVEYLFNNGDITQNELYTLRRIGRQKRLDLAAPAKKEPEKAEKAGTYRYTPEMGESKPECQMEARRAYYGKHYFIDTPLTLKGRGITFIKTYAPGELMESGRYKTGWNHYQVTERAYGLLEEKYTISRECLLD